MDFAPVTALIGGSFDPVHEGHLHVARELQKARPEIEQIVFVPAAQSPGKHPSVAPGRLRAWWLRLAAEPLGWEVWEEELARGGESFTVDTLAAAHSLGARADRLFWVMGADAYENFAHWRAPERIRELARLLVVHRPGTQLEKMDPRDTFLTIPPHPASSSEIRENLANSPGESGHLPESVRRDIKELFLTGKSPYPRK